MELPNNHFSLTESHVVQQICSELFNTTDVKHFAYSRLYHTGKILVLTSIPDYHEYFWKMKLDRKCYVHYPENGVIPLNERLTSSELFHAGTFYRFYYPVLLVNKKAHYTEMFWFATNSTQYSSLNFYLRNIEVMKAFCLYFLEKGHFLIESCKNHLIIPSYQKALIIPRKPEVTKRNQMINAQYFQPRCYYLENAQGEESKLSKRQYECVKNFCKGMSYKEIAINMQISTRTVETYLIKAKQILKCYTTPELKNIFDKNCPQHSYIHSAIEPSVAGCANH